MKLTFSKNVQSTNFRVIIMVTLSMLFGSLFFLSALGLGAASAQSLPTWPMRDGWGVTMFPGLNGIPYCMALSGKPPYGSLDHHMIFAVNSNSSTFYLMYTGEKIPYAPTINLSVDGKALVSLQDIEIGPFDNPNEHQISADMPGAMLSQLIFPSLAEGQTINAQVGNYNYTLSLNGFKQVEQDFVHCALYAQQVIGH